VEIILQRPLTKDEYFKAAVLGWGIELVRSSYLDRAIEAKFYGHD
jgi:hypothetical protein